MLEFTFSGSSVSALFFLVYLRFLTAVSFTSVGSTTSISTFSMTTALLISSNGCFRFLFDTGFLLSAKMKIERFSNYLNKFI